MTYVWKGCFNYSTIPTFKCEYVSLIVAKSFKDSEIDHHLYALSEEIVPLSKGRLVIGDLDFSENMLLKCRPQTALCIFIVHCLRKQNTGK